MNIEAFVADMRVRMGPWLEKSQEVAGVSLDAARSANTIVVGSAQTLVRSNIAVGRDLFGRMQESLERARLDGLKSVMASPMSYLPEGRDALIGACSESMAVLEQTGDKLAKVAMDGYTGVTLKINGGQPTPAPQATPAPRRKAPAKPRATASAKSAAPKPATAKKTTARKPRTTKSAKGAKLDGNASQTSE